MSIRQLEKNYIDAQFYIKDADTSTPEVGVTSLNNIKDLTSKLDIAAGEELLEIQKNDDNGNYEKLCSLSHETAIMFSQFREKLVNTYGTDKKVMEALGSR